MAYDESIYRPRHPDSADPTDVTAADLWEGGEPEPPTSGRHRPVPPAVLNDVFDDPAHGEPGRDRIAVHILWELLLLAGVAVLGYLLYREDPALLTGPARDSLLVSAAALGLLSLGAGLSLRAGAPNLALGPVAVASALHFAENGDRGVVEAMVPAAIAAVLLGLVVAVLVVGFHVPAWAASLGAALAAIVLIQQRPADPVDVQGNFDPVPSALYLFGGFAALALLGGLFGAIKSVRRSVGRFRPVADPAWRRGGLAAVLTGAALVSSMMFALVAGVLMAAGADGPVRPTTGIEWTGMAIGTALLAGTSAFGRRGGVFGTLFSVVLLTLFVTYSDLRGWNIALGAVAAVTMGAGLVVTRLVETFGRPRSAVEREEEWQPEEGAPDPDWGAGQTARSNAWSSALSTQPTESRGSPWVTDRWDTTNR